jgi:hypothetical protein
MAIEILGLAGGDTSFLGDWTIKNVSSPVPSAIFKVRGSVSGYSGDAGLLA